MFHPNITSLKMPGQVGCQCGMQAVLGENLFFIDNITSTEQNLLLSYHWIFPLLHTLYYESKYNYEKSKNDI